METQNIASLFSTILYSSKYTEDMTKEREFIDSLEYAPNSSGNEKSKDNYILRRPELNLINTFIKDRMKKFLRETMKVKNDLVITQSWVNRNEKGTSHGEHRHPNSMMSGVFYFTATNITPIIFSKWDDWGIAFDYEQTNSKNARTATFQAVPGALVLFPSSLNHSVPKNTSDEVRISLSFNTFARDFLGDHDRLTYVKLGKENETSK